MASSIDLVLASMMLTSANVSGSSASGSANAPASNADAIPGSGGTLCSASLVSDKSSPQIVGDPVTWTASAQNCGANPVFQFSVGPTAGPFQVVRDFGEPSFSWTPMQEGSFSIEVAVKSNYAAAETTSAIVNVSVLSRVMGSDPVVSPTANPLVALYSAPAPLSAGTFYVEFRPADAPDDVPWTTTSVEATIAGRSTNLFVAGMLPSTTYAMIGVSDRGPMAAQFFTTGALPEKLYFPTFNLLQPPAPGSELNDNLILHMGVFFNSPDVGLLATDRLGNVTWYYDTSTSDLTAILPLSLAPGGTVFLMGALPDGTNVVREIDLAGNVVRETNAYAVDAQLQARGDDPVIYFNHEALRLANGDIAILGTVDRPETIDGQVRDYYGDMVIVLDANLQVTWTWNEFNYLDVSRGPIDTDTSSDPVDWTHSNSIAWSPADDNLIVSIRHQDWIVKIDYANGTGDGHVVWRLGQDGDFTIISGDPYPWFTHQHYAQYIDPTTLEVFDDGNTRCDTTGDCESRGQVFSLDEQNMTATAILNARLGTYAYATGSDQVLANGNYTFTPGVIGIPPDSSSQTIEVQPDGKIVYDLEMVGFQYRSFLVSDLYHGDNPASTGGNPGHAAGSNGTPSASLVVPAIVAQSPESSVVGLVNTIEVTFNVPVDATTFTPDQVNLSGPTGIISVDAVTPVDKDGRVFDITFADQTNLGAYSLAIGPDIQAFNGVRMAAPYVGTFDVDGPMVIASTPEPNVSISGPLDSIRISFNEPMNPATFTSQQVDYLLGPAGRVSVAGVSPVPGSDNTQFDIQFASQTLSGSYALAIGPDIYDPYGHPMDQDGDFIPGQFPNDLFVESFTLVGPRLIAQTVDAGLGAYRARVTFNVPMDPSTFTLDEIPSFIGPGGPVPVLGVIPVLDSNFTQFDIVFAPLTESGGYSMILGPDIRDRLGNSMSGTYALSFSVGGPRVVVSSPAGNVLTSVDHIRLSFNYPIDPNSFTIDQVVAFTGPSGDIPVDAVAAVPFTNNTQFDVQFDSQSDPGSYVMTIDASIRDSYGNNLDATYTADFTVVNSGGGGPTSGANGATLVVGLVPLGPSALVPLPSARDSAAGEKLIALPQFTSIADVATIHFYSASGTRLLSVPLVSVLDDDLGHDLMILKLASKQR